MKMEKLQVPSPALSDDDIRRCREIALQRRDVVHEIAVAVAAETGVPVRAIYGRRRTTQISEARQLVMYIARKRGLTIPVIAMALDRDTATVQHGINAEKARRGEVG